MQLDRVKTALKFYLSVSFLGDEYLLDIELWSCYLSQRLTIYHGLLGRATLEELEAQRGQGSVRKNVQCQPHTGAFC